MKVTFIGLGIMGSRMAKNLLQHDTDITVYNRSKAPVETLVEMGAKTAASPNEAVQDADVVFTMLSTPEVVESVALTADGFLKYMSPETIWVDSSTVNPNFSRKAAAIAKRNNVQFLDAPVAGTKPHAENAELVFFVGGEKSALTTVEPLMNRMGKKVMHIGKIGMGASFKMLVNAMLAQSMLIFAEAVQLGEKMGMDKDFLLNSLPNLVVSAPFTKAKAEMIRNDDYSVMFPLEWMQKDLHLAALTAYEHQQPLYMVNVAKEIYAAAIQEGFSREDFAAVYKVIAK